MLNPIINQHCIPNWGEIVCCNQEDSWTLQRTSFTRNKFSFLVRALWESQMSAGFWRLPSEFSCIHYSLGAVSRVMVLHFNVLVMGAIHLSPFLLFPSWDKGVWGAKAKTVSQPGSDASRTTPLNLSHPHITANRSAKKKKGANQKHFLPISSSSRKVLHTSSAPLMALLRLPMSRRYTGFPYHRMAYQITRDCTVKLLFV